ncbi:isoprenylcysteine carboxylmethyltransferase family protein [Dokdonia sp.]|uniref:methyltransferase family protein n=1 Tax=Dokdonia sp. TaxID=2024995 RepID=UPI003266558C
MKLQPTDFAFVFIQFVLFFAFIFEISFLQITLPKFVKIAGFVTSIFGSLLVVIALLQLNKNLSPFPSPKSDTQLIKNGIYTYIRHPIYTGILGIVVGYSFFSGSGYRFLITLLLLVLFIYKSRYEEKRLLLVFKDYLDYKKKTGRFLPKINP